MNQFKKEMRKISAEPNLFANSMLSELNCLYNIFYDVNYIVDFSKKLYLSYLCTSYCLINLDLKQSIIYLLMF